eukprot:TRINITY_DN5737_c0_g2_i4.p1 TRINITY_DN5737_c0_g2~~TRINITY_DN5737_c0_g2_i4.p1  ORF type:complete len:457 (+),score=142.12 TRINITY_DN5737_c0_g2_i4:218-1588(+)
MHSSKSSNGGTPIHMSLSYSTSSGSSLTGLTLHETAEEHLTTNTNTQSHPHHYSQSRRAHDRRQPQEMHAEKETEKETSHTTHSHSHSYSYSSSYGEGIREGDGDGNGNGNEMGDGKILNQASADGFLEDEGGANRVAHAKQQQYIEQQQQQIEEEEEEEQQQQQYIEQEEEEQQHVEQQEQQEQQEDLDGAAESVQVHSQLAQYFASCSGRQSVSQTAFDNVRTRSIGVMLGIVREYRLVSDVLVCATVLYIQRFLRHRRTVLTIDNSGPLFAIALNTVSKYYDDFTFNNLTFAQLAGIPVSLFNALEIDFLAALRFNLALHPDRVAAIHSAFLAPVLAPVLVPSKAVLPSSSSPAALQAQAQSQSHLQSQSQSQSQFQSHSQSQSFSHDAQSQHKQAIYQSAPQIQNQGSFSKSSGHSRPSTQQQQQQQLNASTNAAASRPSTSRIGMRSVSRK